MRENKLESGMEVRQRAKEREKERQRERVRGRELENGSIQRHFPLLVQLRPLVSEKTTHNFLSKRAVGYNCGGGCVP